MNKEEIKHFKSLLRQGSLRHMNILLDDKFQKELLNVIKDYEILQERIDKAIDKLKEHKYDLDYETWSIYKVRGLILFDLVDILGGKE